MIPAAAQQAERVRNAAGCFALNERALVEVRGGDRVRWADGMLSNDVGALAPGPRRSGCQALLLTPQGRIVADLHVLARADSLWLELAAGARAELLERLEKFIIADDVELRDVSGTRCRFALEGPRSPAWLARTVGRDPGLEPDCGVEVELGGTRAWVGAWGISGEAAFQIMAPADAEADVRAALEEAAGSEWLLADEHALEVLRIEAGRPRFGSELGRDVLPAEVGLVGRAVSLDKGCYTGQEIVARMAARGAAAHRLVGLRFAESSGPGGSSGSGGSSGPGGSSGSGGIPGDSIRSDGKSIGELTSRCRSASAGEIGLGFVRSAHAEPGREVEVGNARARLADLPFVEPRTS